MYDTYFGFTDKPFQLNPDPRFFFNSSTHKRALSYLRYGIAQGEGFIVITGDVGTGKTTLVRTLFQSLDGARVVAGKIANTMLQPDDLLRLVAAEFGLPYESVSKAEILRNMEVFFRTCIQEKRRVLLVVDEAQNLPPAAVEELRMLSNFEWNGQPLLQTFLLGQREFRNTMRSPRFEQLRQRVIAAYHLRALDKDEAQSYVEHRLKLVSWKGDPKITDEAFKRIHEFTRGIPRNMNVLCDRLLLYACLEEIHEIGWGTLRSVLDDIQNEFCDVNEASQTPRPMSTDRLHSWSANGNAAVVGDNAGERWLEAQGPSYRPDDAMISGQDHRASVERSISSFADALRTELSELREEVLAKVRAEKAAATEE